MKAQIKTSLSSQALIQNPKLNKGTAFTKKERDELNLHGFLPTAVSNLTDQVRRRYARFSSLGTNIEKSLFLSELQNTNEVLFYKLVSEHVKEMLPLVYTPTVGDMSQQFSELHSQHRGLYLSLDIEDKMDDIFSHLDSKDIEVVVVTDGERILGLGDLGIGGIAIPIGKLALYTLFGGINPSKTLPIVLDVGTNNKELLNNRYYQGLKHERVQGERYDRFIASFIKALKKHFPKVLLQWEDFAKNNASRLLNTYRDKLLSFNDDIQGTAAVALSAMITASHIQKIPLKNQKVVIFGAGSAGLGIAEKIVFTLTQEGVDKHKAYESVYLIDRDGLILTTSQVSKEQAVFAKKPMGSKQDLESVIRQVKPTLLIGVSGQAKTFTESIVKAMMEYQEHPAIFPLSNPNKCAEADPQDILNWTHGKAIIATGSPFKEVKYNNEPYPISQCNNVYIFPGVGLGAISFHLPKLTDKMFLEASKMLSSQSPALEGKGHELFPPFEKLKESSLKIAQKVVEVAIEEGLIPKMSADQILAKLKNNMWMPEYPEIIPG
jgi:malate dehydrogenase (oxaloacetate-decarboxylating)